MSKGYITVKHFGDPVQCQSLAERVEELACVSHAEVKGTDVTISVTDMAAFMQAAGSNPALNWVEYIVQFDC